VVFLAGAGQLAVLAALSHSTSNVKHWWGPMATHRKPANGALHTNCAGVHLVDTPKGLKAAGISINDAA